jgi:tryptophan synthase alpha chain
VAAYSSGFIYLVSRTGVTGERSEVSASAVPLIQAMRAITDLPLALGFGISTPEQVAAAGREADGVVVGSAIVRLVEQHAADPDLAQRVEGFTRWLTGGRP